jgi:hypothetical protein
MIRRSLLSLNPELQRLFWLELTPGRLLVMPLLLALVFGGTYLVRGATEVASAAEIALCFLLVLWGSRLAADSFQEEVTGRTWDIQRLSVVNPLALALGKWLGGTSFAWYGALFCIAALGAADADRAVRLLPATLVAGLVAQTGALFVAMVFQQGGGRLRGGVAQAFGVVAGAGLLNTVLIAPPMSAPLPDLLWYGVEIRPTDFILATVLAQAGWFWLGAATLTRRELGEHDGPVMWTAFLVYACLLALGAGGTVLSPHPGWSYHIFAATLVAAGLTYVAVVMTTFSAAHVKRLRFAGWTALWREIPSWAPSAVIALGGAVWLAAVSERPAAIIGWTGNFLRDIAIVCLIKLLLDRRAGLVLVVIFALLYLFFPFILSEAAGRAWGQLLRPLPDASLQGAVGPWVLAAIVVAPLARLVGKHWQSA